MKKSKKYLAEYNTCKFGVKESQLDKSEIHKLVPFLNKYGFDLGSGHDGVNLIEIGNGDYKLVLETYCGGPTYTITLKQM
jgi:hypothetical protein